ncbi:hypothetical protein BDF21DRAFT_453419 [Thamnidium elegans]|nr:hypothetical protein BDF21DRAFT_453419 [Thamnidium elegans]
MTYNCSICFESLVSSTNPISALACGHTFHKPCINRWINFSSPPQCPLCKKTISKTKIISPLFFSDSNGETVVEESSEAHEKIAKLEENNKELKLVIGTLNREAHEAKEEIAHLRTEISRVRNQRSYVKIIKRVVELDNDLSSAHMQEYLGKVRTLTPSNLYVHVGALRARQMRAENEIYKISRLCENKKRENEDLRDRMEQLHDHIRHIESSRSLPRRAGNVRPRVRRRNVVVLDSDIEDEDENDDDGRNQNDRFSVGQELAEGDEARSDESRPDEIHLSEIRPDEIHLSEIRPGEIQRDEIRPDEVSEDDIALLFPETISEDEAFVVEEHVPSTSRRPFKRQNVSIDNDETTSSSRPKKIIKIDLTDDDDA